MIPQILINSFTGKRNILELTKGDDKKPFKIWAIPITSEEEEDIKLHAKKHKPYREIYVSSFYSIGDPAKPSKKELQALPFKLTINMDGDTCKSYYYDKLDKFPTNRDHCIPFEDANVAWRYLSKRLLHDIKYDKVFLVKLNN